MGGGGGQNVPRPTETVFCGGSPREVLPPPFFFAPPPPNTTVVVNHYGDIAIRYRAIAIHYAAIPKNVWSLFFAEFLRLF